MKLPYGVRLILENCTNNAYHVYTLCMFAFRIKKKIVGDDHISVHGIDHWSSSMHLNQDAMGNVQWAMDNEKICTFCIFLSFLF